MPQTISEITRRNITDYMRVEQIVWHGRMDEVPFLSRLYDLKTLPSHDSRFRSFERDIIQHRVANYDWEDDWVFDDGRTDLRHGSDENFVAFLAEMLHPLVRSDESEVEALADHFNQVLRRDGWELIEVDQLSGRPIFAGRRVTNVKTPTSALNLDRYPRLSDEQLIRDHLRRIDAGIQRDPAAAIASSKELVETTCKLILNDYDIEYSKRDDVVDLYKRVAKTLRLRAEDIPQSKRGSEAAQRALRALAPLVQALAELRNELGLGHGPARRSPGTVRHARLAFNAATNRG